MESPHRDTTAAPMAPFARRHPGKLYLCQIPGIQFGTNQGLIAKTVTAFI